MFLLVLSSYLIDTLRCDPESKISRQLFFVAHAHQESQILLAFNHAFARSSLFKTFAQLPVAALVVGFNLLAFQGAKSAITFRCYHPGIARCAAHFNFHPILICNSSYHSSYLLIILIIFNLHFITISITNLNIRSIKEFCISYFIKFNSFTTFMNKIYFMLQAKQ